jgi:hypothetical protein
MTRTEPELMSIEGASCALYREAPSWNGRRTTAVGKFAFTTVEAGSALLAHVADQVRRDGYEAIVGPMDGDTWHAYRVVTQSDNSAPYFLEPVSGNHDCAALNAAGFNSISSYVSARATVADAIGKPAPPVDGITISQWDGRDAGHLIAGLFDLSQRAFAKNAFYKPIARDAFMALYQPILPAIDPRLVYFANGPKGELAGYLFAIPDRLQGPKPTTGIIKTYASTVRGVGYLLVDTAHRTLQTLGYTHVVHALMHVDNASRERSSRHHGTIFRRYDLMALDLVVPV